MNQLIQARRIAYSIRDTLIQRLSETGYIGDTNLVSNDLKSHHSIDDIAIKAVMNELKDSKVAIYLEDEKKHVADGANYSIYIDPVDGSLNWDRGTGDPCIVIAMSDKIKISCLDDLNFAFVYGLRSGDEYWVEDNKAYYFCKLTQSKYEINSAQTVGVENMVGYFRPGYGMAERQLRRTLPLFYKVRDIRAMDNAGIEICEIARGAADLMIEARDGSDGFNLLAYPILKAAGGAIFTLTGADISSKPISLDNKYNYIALGNPSQIKEIISSIGE